MQIVYKILITMLFLLSIEGCTSCSQNTELDKMTMDELEVFFENNKPKFKSIVNLCTRYPEIHTVNDISLNILLISYESNITKEAKNAIVEIRSLIKDIKLLSIRCGRRTQILKNQLLGVSFSLYSEGLMFGGGYAQSILFESKAYRDFRKYKKQPLLTADYPSLGEDGWFIYIVDDRD